MSIVELKCGRIYDSNKNGPVRCEQRTCEDIAKCMLLVDEDSLQQSYQNNKDALRREQIRTSLAQNLNFEQTMNRIK